MIPTFPINESELRQRACKAVFGSPLTWVALLPTIGVWGVVEASPFVYLPMGILTLGGLFGYWAREIKKRRVGWIGEEIVGSNRQQDHVIKLQIAHFQQQQANWEGTRLQRALKHKQAIEARLLYKNPDLEIWERIETLLDTIVFSMIDKLESNRIKPSSVIQQQIEDALHQLAETEISLEDMITPHYSRPDLEPSQVDELATTLQKLKEEREIAQRVKSRLESQFSETTYGCDLSSQDSSP